MNIVKILAALGAVTLSSQALAQTHFECGTVACSAFGSAPITAIDAFYATQKGPKEYDEGPGIYAQVNRVDTEVYTFLGLINPDVQAAKAAPVRTRITAAAPEMSLVSTSSALIMLLGFIAVLRGRRAARTFSSNLR
jgi:hypothetical protein